MADIPDDKKVAEGAGSDAAYDVLEKDFQEVRVAICRMRITGHLSCLVPDTVQLFSSLAFAKPKHLPCTGLVRASAG